MNCCKLYFSFLPFIPIIQGMDPALILGVNVTRDSREELVIVRGTLRRVFVPGTREVVVVPCARDRGTVCVVCVSVTIMESALDSTAKSVW